ncbi:MAG: DsbE family thiol:disulfide interchange protein [Pseudomonadota bacterium]
MSMGRLALVCLPLVVFSALAMIFFIQLVSGKQNDVVPSALIGKPAPVTVLPGVEGLKYDDGRAVRGLTAEDFSGKLTVLNVFASWCVPCRAEHPLLVDLARDKRIHLVGLNYKDKPEDAARFLAQLGNPYAAIGADRQGGSVIDWGLYGVPETYIVTPDGKVAYKQVGPLEPKSYRAFWEELEKHL